MATLPITMRKKTAKNIFLLILLIVQSQIALSSDQNTPPDKKQQLILWPAPPEKARIQFVESLYGEKEILGESESGFWQSLGNFIFGKREQQRFIRPYSIAIAKDGTVAVTDPGAPGIHIFNKTSKRYKLIQPEENKYKLNSPVGIAFTKNNTILVTDSKMAEVIEFTLEGEAIRKFGSKILKQPTGIAVHPKDNRIFVTDTHNHQIIIFDDKGKLLDRFGKRGSIPGTFNYPTFIVFDINGNLYMTDTMNFRVQIFSNKGVPKLQFGKLGDRLGNFSKPKGIAVDNHGQIYVIESFYDHLLIYDAKGNFLLPVGGSGTKAGQFNLPAGVAIYQDLVFVTDSYNRRIQVFKRLSYLKNNDSK